MTGDGAEKSVPFLFILAPHQPCKELVRGDAKNCRRQLNVKSEMTEKSPNVRSKPNGRIKGTTIIYRTHQGELDINSADFRVDIGGESNPKQFRAYRLRRQKAGKSLPEISIDALHRDIVLIVGTGACPNFIVSWLYRIINEIRNNKLVTGIKSNEKISRERFIPGKRVPKRPVHTERPYVRQL